MDPKSPKYSPKKPQSPPKCPPHPPKIPSKEPKFSSQNLPKWSQNPQKRPQNGLGGSHGWGRCHMASPRGHMNSFQKFFLELLLWWIYVMLFKADLWLSGSCQRGSMPQTQHNAGPEKSLVSFPIPVFSCQLKQFCHTSGVA